MTDTEPMEAKVLKRICDSESKEDLKESFEYVDEYMEDESNSLTKKRAGAWAFSIATHSLVGLLFSVIVFVESNKDDNFDYPPIQTKIEIEKPPVVKEDKLPIKLEKEDVVKIDNPDPKADDKPIIPIDVDIPVEVETDNKLTKGELDNVSVANLGGKGFNFAIGAGSGGGGIYGDRRGSEKRAATIRGYGPRARGAESSVDAALRWLAMHQAPTGEWDAVNYFKFCDQGDKCEPGNGAAGNANIALTGYAILCFSGAGHDHITPSLFRKNVIGGVNYLLSKQNRDGTFGERNYENAIATQALCELLALSNDNALREPCQKAINSILSRQAIESNKGYGLCWDYVNPNPARNDFSVSGWNIFALKAGASAGLNIKGGLAGAKYAVESAWKSANPNWNKLSDPYSDKSVFPYVWNAVTGKTEKDHLSFVGACSAVFLGHKIDDIMLRTLINDMNARFLDNNEFKNNAYALYYASLASFQVDKECFNKWQEKFVPWLLETQYKDGCHRGTWNYPNQKFHGWDTSRVLMHCYLTLSLEVVYRYKATTHK